jgi:hypothetical protein
MLTISVEGIEEIRERFAALIPKLQDKALRTLAQDVFDDVQDGADKHTKTGALARSVFRRQIAPDAWVVGHDRQMAPHALFVVWGTRPHLIKPNKRKALRWPSDGKFIFAHTVHHPGYKGDNYLYQAAMDAHRHMAEIIAQLQREL